MKRYEIINDYGCGYGVTPEEKIDGEWVRYEDVFLMKLALDSAIADIEEYSKELKILRGDGSKQPENFDTISAIECNCAKMTNAPPYHNRIPLNLHSFICPVHGYKKV